MTGQVGIVLTRGENIKSSNLVLFSQQFFFTFFRFFLFRDLQRTTEIQEEKLVEMIFRVFFMSVDFFSLPEKKKKKM